MNYRISEYRLNDEVIRVKLEGQIAAVGALYHNGFAFHLPGILRGTIDENAIRYTINDVWDFVSAGENCNYHRTEPGCGSGIQMQFSIN
jgi:hypothetical protein